jgi:hypothetical protein
MRTGWRVRPGFQASIVVLGWNGDTGQDADDTLGLATWVTLRPGEKYHRRPACASVRKRSLHSDSIYGSWGRNELVSAIRGSVGS